MHDASKHFYLTLTKRAERLRYLPAIASAAGVPWPLPNVGIGVTAENQDMWDARTGLLQDVGAALTFVSVEPMLGPIHGGRVLPGWVLCGGESGPIARPMHPAWVRSLRDQCTHAGTPFLFKQWGAFGIVDRPSAKYGLVAYLDDGEQEWDCGFLRKERPHAFMANVGKKAAGRLLDGVEHNDVPLVIRRHFGVT